MRNKPVLLLLTIVFLSSCNKSEQPPNIIVMLTDDQRPETLSCYNDSCCIKTPNIDCLAENGIRFTNGFVTTPICCVSRASIITGQYASKHRVHYFLYPIPDDIFADSYPAHMKNAGYYVGALGKYGVGVTPLVTNTFDVFEAQADQGPAFRNYLGRKMHDAEWLTVKTNEFLDKVPEDQPFCLQINYKEPHGSSRPAPEDDDLLEQRYFEKVAMDSPEEFQKLPEYVQRGLSHEFCYHRELYRKGDLNFYMRMYHEKIVSVERSVGEIMKTLEKRGLADNTVIIFLSDHGTHFGEKQLSGKWTPYDESLKIPFIVYDPRVKAQKGKVLDDMVLNIDIAPTLLELAGVEVPETMDGRSMVSLIQGKEKSWRKDFFFEHYCSPAGIFFYVPRNEGIRTEDEKYVRWLGLDGPIEEYYRLEDDPFESNNLIDKSQYAASIEELRGRFNQWRESTPVNYEQFTYDDRPQFYSKDIDWDRFREKWPELYASIKAEVDRLGVTWQEAENDWEIRYKICAKLEYWY